MSSKVNGVMEAESLGSRTQLLCVCVCACMFVRACVRMRACMRVCVHVYVRVTLKPLTLEHKVSYFSTLNKILRENSTVPKTSENVNLVRFQCLHEHHQHIRIVKTNKDNNKDNNNPHKELPIEEQKQWKWKQK